MTSPSTADEASSPPATARTCGITSSAESTPTKTISGADAAPQHAVAGQRLGRQIPARHPAVDQARDDQRDEQDAAEDGQAVPGVEMAARAT